MNVNFFSCLEMNVNFFLFCLFFPFKGDGEKAVNPDQVPEEKPERSDLQKFLSSATEEICKMNEDSSILNSIWSSLLAAKLNRLENTEAEELKIKIDNLVFEMMKKSSSKQTSDGINEC